MALIDFVFTRAGTATRIDKNGVIQTVPANFPVVNFDDGDLLGYYSQRSVTNLLQRSEEFDNAYWTKTALNTTGTPPFVNVAVAPDGTTTAEKLIPNTVNTQHDFRRAGATATVTGNYTQSVYAKAGGRRFLQVGVGSAFAGFDLETGDKTAAAGGVSSKIEALPNGWYRCIVTIARTIGESLSTIFIATSVLSNSGTGRASLGNDSDGIFLWGAQLVEGSQPLSYIRTEATAVTRPKDVATASALTLSPLSNVQFKANFPTGYELVLAGLQATVSGYATIRLELSPTAKTLFVNGVEQDSDTGSYDWSGITSIELGHFDGDEQPNFEIADLRINE